MACLQQEKYFRIFFTETLVHSTGKRFICARVDTPKDAFLILFGLQSFWVIQLRTMEEGRLQEDNNFQLLVKELRAFIRLCIIRSVIKGRNEIILN